MSLEDKSRNTIYLYNHVREQILEYSLEIVEPKLRELQPGDISLKELDSAFRTVRKAFNPGKVVKKWNDATQTAPVEDSDEPEIHLDHDTSIDDFVDDDS